MLEPADVTGHLHWGETTFRPGQMQDLSRSAYTDLLQASATRRRGKRPRVKALPPTHTRSLLSCLSTGSVSVLGSAIRLCPCPAPRLKEGVSVGAAPPQLLPVCPAAVSLNKWCVLAAVKPCNIEKEKDRFFKSGFNYNPRFEYSSPPHPQTTSKYSSASERFLPQAVRIMELALQRYGSYEKFEQATGGNLLRRNRIWYQVKKYMEKEGCAGEIAVHLSDNLLSRASMSVINSKPTLTINTCTAREHWLEGILRHEIGTHFLRGVNNSLQPWGSGAGRREHGLRPSNPTEEGLASLHSVLLRRDPLLWRAALLYYTVSRAARLSFCQLFHDLGRFLHEPATRWEYCVRAKRGQSDTALPGCFSKDQVYLEGVLSLLRFRRDIDFPLLMALGKVSYEDVERLKGLALMERVRIPHFLRDRQQYSEQLQRVMEVNSLTDEELRTLI